MYEFKGISYFCRIGSGHVRAAEAEITHIDYGAFVNKALNTVGPYRAKQHGGRQIIS